MIISHKYRYVFIEVPHTASTAISAQLTEHYDGQAVLHKHANYTEFRSQATKDEQQYFVFATVRNPLDHAATLYQKMLVNHHGMYTEPKNWLENGGWIPPRTLRQFRYIQDRGDDFSAYFNEFHTSVYHNWFLLRHHDFGKVMRFENLQQDFDIVLDTLGLEKSGSIPTVNSTGGKRDYTAYYQADTHQHVGAMYGPFLKEWGYTLPADWNAPIPLRSQAEYEIKERAVQTLAKRMELSPYNPTLGKLKSVLDRFI